MSILAISGSPSSHPSRSSTLLEHAASRLRAAGLEVDPLGLGDVPPDDLILARSGSDAAIAFRRRVEPSDAVLIATPVYNASIPGGLKALLDLLPEKALAGKLVLPLASGGSAGHQLAIEYSLKPVLSALGARHVLAGVFASDADVAWPDGPDRAATMRPALAHRLDAAVDALIESLDRQGAVTRALSHRAMQYQGRARQAEVAESSTPNSSERFPERCSA